MRRLIMIVVCLSIAASCGITSSNVATEYAETAMLKERFSENQAEFQYLINTLTQIGKEVVYIENINGAPYLRFGNARATNPEENSWYDLLRNFVEKYGIECIASRLPERGCWIYADCEHKQGVYFAGDDVDDSAEWTWGKRLSELDGNWCVFEAYGDIPELQAKEALEFYLRYTRELHELTGELNDANMHEAGLDSLGFYPYQTPRYVFYSDKAYNSDETQEKFQETFGEVLERIEAFLQQQTKNKLYRSNIIQWLMVKADVFLGRKEPRQDLCIFRLESENILIWKNLSFLMK